MYVRVPVVKHLQSCKTWHYLKIRKMSCKILTLWKIIFVLYIEKFVRNCNKYWVIDNLCSENSDQCLDIEFTMNSSYSKCKYLKALQGDLQTLNVVTKTVTLQNNRTIPIRLYSTLFGAFKCREQDKQCCSKTTLTGESRFHISTPLGIEPGSLMTGSQRVDHWTSGTVY